MFRTKYDLSFTSVNGVPVSVEIEVDGYLGDPIVRRLGAPPVLKTQKSGRIISTSVDITAECMVFGEFSEFYTSDPRHFRVLIGRGDDGEGETLNIWKGYVTPEIYSEPYIAPPYDVRVYANDGLGELKLYDWEPVGRKSIADTLYLLLEATGFDDGIKAVCSISPAGGTAPDFFDDVFIDLDYMAGRSYYDVLQEILESIDADILRSGPSWVIIRETDATPKAIPPFETETNLETVSVLPSSSLNGSSSGSIAGTVRTIGQMGVADMWPIGFMTRSVEPAKKKVVVKSPWHFQNAFDDPDMVDYGTWSEAGQATGGTNGYTLGTMNVGASAGQISQTFTLKRLTKNIKMTVRAVAQYVSSSQVYGKTRGVGVWARYQNTRTSEIMYFSQHGDSSDWEGSYTEPDVQAVDVRVFGFDDPRDVCKELSFDIPNPGVNEEVYLQLAIVGYGVVVYSASAILEDNEGYKDTILIDNGARGDADEVEITGGRMTSSNIVAERFYEGLLVASSGDAFYSFDDANYSGKDFMSLNALNRARSVGLPRIKITGRFNIPPTGFLDMPLLVKDGSTNMLIKSYEWDLYNEEVQLEAVSLPAVSITVDSETITSLGD